MDAFTRPRIRSIPMQLTSTAFQHMGAIPAKYTCDGDDVSPPLAWDGAPNETKSLVLIVDDPDAPDPAAPKRVYVHWVVYDLPATARNLPEATQVLPAGARDGKNDFGNVGYGGPCPPIGRHRYFHKLYALDTTLGDRGQLAKSAVLEAMKDHILAEAELIGTYERKRK
jgi:Raf kinase inhibitor-like YbhB/YbcL family protein